MEFQNSKTYENLLNAINEELIGSTKYVIYSEKAKQEGYIKISKIYKELARNEKEHAEVFQKIIQEGILPSTFENLNDSIVSENKQWTETYQKYAETAKEEGFPDVEKLFHKISAIENHHEYLLQTLSNEIKNQTVFSKSSNSVWICMKCGCIWFDKNAPEQCPVCGTSKAYFQVNAESK